MQGHPNNPGNGSTDYLPFSHFKTCQFSPGNHTIYLEMTVIDQNGTQKTMSTTKSIEAITYDDLKRMMN